MAGGWSCYGSRVDTVGACCCGDSEGGVSTDDDEVVRDFVIFGRPEGIVQTKMHLKI